MDVTQAIRTRSSIRGYADRPLTQQQLQALLEAGLQAPTATNRQELHFTVLPGSHPLLAEIEADKNALRGLAAPAHDFYYEAPAVIIVSAEDGFRWSAVDAGIAVENMALQAHSMGLGSLIIGCIYDVLRGERQPYYTQALRLPQGYSYAIALAVGYPATEKQPHTYDFARQVTCL